MELILTLGIFGISFFLLSLGIILSKKHRIHDGSCGSKLVVKGEELSCGICASKDAEVCPSGDKEGFATLAQIANPTRKKKITKLPFSTN
jgi:hypothetical protein